MKLKKDQAGGIRPDIVDAAAQVFGRSGYERATLDEIASIVGIQKGSLYHHIDSKEQLLFAIHIQLYEKLDRSMEEAVRDKSSGAMGQIDRMLRTIIETVAQHREMVNVFLRDYRALEPNHLEELIQHRRRFRKRMETVVRQALAEEGRTDLDIRYTVYAIIGMCYWVNEWLDGRDVASAGDGRSRDDHHAIASNFSRLLIDGLRARGAEAETSKVAKERAVRPKQKKE
jgi:AcrR family transcriptional regulator